MDDILVDDIQGLFDHNREWAAQIEKDDPGFFGRLAKQQEPEYLFKSINY